MQPPKGTSTAWARSGIKVKVEGVEVAVAVALDEHVIDDYRRPTTAVLAAPRPSAAHHWFGQGREPARRR